MLGLGDPGIGSVGKGSALIQDGKASLPLTFAVSVGLASMVSAESSLEVILRLWG